MAKKSKGRVRTGLRSVGRALAHRNYRLFFVGQGISLIGTWMTRVATGWLVYRLHGPDAAFWLGAVGFAGQVPAFFLAPLAGVLVDRWNRHRCLLVTQELALLQSAGLAAVAFSGVTGNLALGLILALSLCQGFINAFDMPARQSFLHEMIDRRSDLANAIALNSSLVNGSRLIGPSIAGVVIALSGEGVCFALDAVSYVAVVGSLLAMRLPPREAGPPPGPVLHGLKEGFRYAFGFAPIRTLLLLLALISFMGAPYSVLLPIFAADILHGGPGMLGLLMAAGGLGALCGALYLAARETVVGLGRTIVLATSLFGCGLIAFANCRVPALSMAALMVTGFGMMVLMAACNTILQTIVDEDKRGRVMSLYAMAFLGVTPFGSLFAGYLATLVGPEMTVVVGGIASLIGAGLFARQLPAMRLLVRPIYRRLGIMPGLTVDPATPQVPPEA